MANDKHVVFGVRRSGTSLLALHVASEHSLPYNGEIFIREYSDGVYDGVIKAPPEDFYTWLVTHWSHDRVQKVLTHHVDPSLYNTLGEFLSHNHYQIHVITRPTFEVMKSSVMNAVLGSTYNMSREEASSFDWDSLNIDIPLKNIGWKVALDEWRLEQLKITLPDYQHWDYANLAQKVEGDTNYPVRMSNYYPTLDADKLESALSEGREKLIHRVKNGKPLVSNFRNLPMK